MVTSSNSSNEQSTDTSQITAPQADPVAGKTIAEILGEIVWLMTQDAVGREMKVADIEGLVMPAIIQKRFHIKYAQVPDMRRPGAAALQPVSVQIFNAGTIAQDRNLRPSLLVEFNIKSMKG